jgi:hypothetical protein
VSKTRTHPAREKLRSLVSRTRDAERGPEHLDNLLKSAYCTAAYSTGRHGADIFSCNTVAQHA